MTMYKREFNAHLSRYNSRKRELQASMVEYSERVKAIHAIQEESLLTENNAGLEIRARRHHITRLSDPGHITTPTNNGNSTYSIRRRPHSLDDKELLRNKKLNQSMVAASRRGAKSEYGHPIVIPTESPPFSNHSESPEINRSSNTRLNFVSTSDLYDLVDFGKHSKPTPRQCKARLSCLEDGMKLIEQIDIRSRREKKTAWGDKKSESEQSENSSSSSSTNILRKKDTQNSETGENNVLGGFITGRSIKSQRKCNNDNRNINHENNVKADFVNLKRNNTSTKKSIHLNEALPVITPAEKNGIYPLNAFLETVLTSCKSSVGKLRHRPKRAKRMQLHKSDLVVIPEHRGASADNHETFSQENVQDYRVMPRHGTPIPSNSSLAAIKEGISRSKKQQGPINFSERDFDDGDSNVNNGKNYLPVSDKSGKFVSKQKKKKQNVQTLDAIIVKNSIMYPELPWENGRVDTNTKMVNNMDHNLDNSTKQKKMKRLVFLKDQPENIYRR